MRQIVVAASLFLSISTVSFAVESLDKNKFLAPPVKSAQSTDPLSKDRGDLNSNRTTSPVLAGGKVSVAPTGGMCPEGYYCVSTQNGADLKCYAGTPHRSAGDCGQTTEFCAAIQRRLANGETLEGGQLGYYKYCVD